MTNRIFLQKQDGELEDMHEEPYSSESVLQSLLESHPSLLAGDQMNPSHPREWILIAREMDVPGEADAHGRWSLDHLFLDQEGIPTLVEVKRSTNTEIRRKVVGQMLDYAANGVLYWPIRKIQSLFEEACNRNGTSPEDALLELCGDDIDPEQFWQTVETNLNAGRIRLVFVADEIPRELRTIIEFLNGQMERAEIFGVEVKQYTSRTGARTLVPRVIGQTISAERAKGTRSRSKRWDNDSFFAALEESVSAEAVSVVRRIRDWAVERGCRIRFGSGGEIGTLIVVVDHGGREHTPIALRTKGQLTLRLLFLRRQPPFSDPSMERELLDRLNQLEGIHVPSDPQPHMPRIPLDSLSRDGGAGVLGVLDWIVDQIRKS